jgi:hypothetical protein
VCISIEKDLIKEECITNEAQTFVLANFVFVYALCLGASVVKLPSKHTDEYLMHSVEKSVQKIQKTTKTPRHRENYKRLDFLFDCIGRLI